MHWLVCRRSRSTSPDLGIKAFVTAPITAPVDDDLPSLAELSVINPAGPRELRHSVDCIENLIDQYLLKLDAIGPDGSQRRATR
jgi:hypothetical protein